VIFTSTSSLHRTADSYSD